MVLRLRTNGANASHVWCGGVKVMQYVVKIRAVYCYKGLIQP
ncbi:hypothetical protein HMPREF9148_00990 [Prevotella sp. F0091]|nr:hypothetical protein HMPREF9148_00990 [Prevotella sp. F0091]